MQTKYDAERTQSVQSVSKCKARKKPNWTDDGWRMTLCALPCKWKNGGQSCGQREDTEQTFQSKEIVPCGWIPTLFTCEGQDTSPSFQWTPGPRGTRSYALLMDDPDAIPVTGGVFAHFGVVNLPRHVLDLKLNEQNWSDLSAAIVVLRNDFGTNGWAGPCPPPLDPAHTYRFTLYSIANRILPDIDSETKLTVEMFDYRYTPLILHRSQFFARFQRTVEESFDVLLASRGDKSESTEEPSAAGGGEETLDSETQDFDSDAEVAWGCY